MSRRFARGKRRLAVFAAVLAVLLASPVQPARAQPEGPTLAPTRDEPMAPARSGALIQARAAIAIEAESGRILYANSVHEQLPPASLTKMVTAMVAIDRADLGTVITASANSMAEPSVIGLEPGDRLPLREAIYGLLLNSGNDVALAIAESVGNGSIDRFVDWMNIFVRSLGLRETHFANPNGLDRGEHYSSAYDLAVIARVFMRQPFLRDVVAEQRHDYYAPPLWAFRNINRFLGAYPGAEGIKTGYETRAGRLLAASVTRDGRRVITVVCNSPDYVAETATLMDYAFARLATRLSAGVPSAAPPSGRLDRMLVAASGRFDVSPMERPVLRSRLRADLDALERDPGLQAGPASVYDRLKAVADIPPGRL